MYVCFFADDREEYLNLLSQSASKHALDFLAWCLMSNHAHFVMVPRQERSLTRMFGAVHRRCTRMVNCREGRRGPLWHERAHSYPTDPSFPCRRSIGGDETYCRVNSYGLLSPGVV